MAFSGGGANKQFSPFTITANQAPQQQTGTSSFTFGTGTAGGSTGFNFSSGVTPVATATASAPQLSFTAATPAATSSSLFNFGGGQVPAGSTAGGSTAPLSFGFSTPTPSATPSGSATSLTGALGTPNQPALSFGVAPVPSTTSLPGLPATTAPVSFTNAPPAPAPNTITPTFGVPASTQATATPTPASTTAAAPTSGFSFGGGSASSNVTNPIKPTTTTSVSTGTGGTGSGDATTTPAPQLTSTTTTTQSNAVSQMNFRQLQDAINKWMLDLQEQEKVFLEQATKVNAWDRTLITNGDKIAKLNDSITKVKNDHNRLEHALDYLKTQQQEFEGFLEPLEAGLPVNIPVEPEREHLYSLTENVDTQLQQMAEDLKEVIRHINESNKTVDKNDPISQILRILNEHTDALQWVEDNANQVRKSLEDVSKQHQMAKKEHERSLRQMFK